MAFKGTPPFPPAALAAASPTPAAAAQNLHTCVYARVQSMTGQVARAPVLLKRQEMRVQSFQPGPRSSLLTSVTPLISTDILLDDIVLTHSLFLPTEKFLQELHQ